MTDNETNALLARSLWARLHLPETGGMPPSNQPHYVPSLPVPPAPAWFRALPDQERQLDELQNNTSGSAPPNFGARLPSYDAFEPPAMRLLRDWRQLKDLIDWQRRMDEFRRPELWPSAPPNYDIPQDLGPLNSPNAPPVMPMPPRPPRC